MSSNFRTLLEVFKNEIRQYVLSRSNIQYNTGTDVSHLLAGQTITRGEIQKTSSFSVMSTQERQIIDEILDSMVKNNGNERGKQLIKKIPGIMPYTDEGAQVVTNIMPFVPEELSPVEFKDAA